MRHLPARLDILIACVLIVGAMLIRSLHFVPSLNFSTDQAVFSTRALEIWRNREITFAGPTASFNYHGRYLIQSAAIYYATLLFLLPAGFDPIGASVLFMLLAAMMCWPLYFGMKQLTNRRAAVVMTALYAFLPIFVNFTRFLFNPNYQLALLPLLVYCWAKFWTTKSEKWLLVSGVVGGFLLLFHYQLVILLVGLSVAVVWPKNWRRFGIWVAGLVIGFSPMVLFELRSGFYMTNTIWLFLTHFSEMTAKSSASGEGGEFPMHYILSVVFSLLILFIYAAVKRFPAIFGWRQVSAFAGILFVGSLSLYLQKPTHAFGMPAGWSYEEEQKVHQIIVDQKIDNFAVVNTLYETTASVQYFLLKRDYSVGWTSDYSHNHYLFVIAPKNHTEFAQDSAYELNTFVPAKVVQSWQLTETRELYLLERTTK